MSSGVPIYMGNVWDVFWSPYIYNYVECVGCLLVSFIIYVGNVWDVF